MPRRSALSQFILRRMPRGWHFVLVVALVLSAWATACSDRLSFGAWLGWVAIVPLFAAIRGLRPLSAAGCGVLWGACVAMLHPVSLGEQHSWSPLVMALVAGAYTGLGSALTLWIGFSPFVLGVGWMIVEFLVSSLGCVDGLLSASQAHTVFMDHVGRALGYVLIAFIVAYANAAVVAALARVGLRWSRHSRFASTRKSTQFLKAQFVGRLSVLDLQPSHSRAPPLNQCTQWPDQ